MLKILFDEGKKNKKFVTLCAIDDECASFSFLPIITAYTCMNVVYGENNV